MNKIIILPNNILCPKGLIIKFNLKKKNLCDILLDNNILIDHFCEKFGKCTTCFIIVKEGSFFLNKIEYEEVESLKKKNLFKKNFRLSCQVIFMKFGNIVIKLGNVN